MDKTELPPAPEFGTGSVRPTAQGRLRGFGKPPAPPAGAPAQPSKPGQPGDPNAPAPSQHVKPLPHAAGPMPLPRHQTEE